MKIGILTYYGDLNCGTCLQALATLQVLKKVYPVDEVEIIPFHGFRPKKIPYKTYNIKYIIEDIKRFRKYSIFTHKRLGVKHDIIIKDVDKALSYIESRNYDVIYVGADTLLELDRLPKGYDGISAYWLKDVKAKKILIAASSKNVSYKHLTWRQREDLKSAASQFTHIGVRDRATYNLMEALVENTQNIKYIPDPTFTYSIDYKLIDRYLSEKKIKIPARSVFIQCYGDDYWVADEVKKLKTIGYTIITNRDFPWTDIRLIDMSPEEQVGLYKYVEFVITHRFHDGVFCLKNLTPVLIYIKSGKTMIADGESKHISLLKDFGLYPQAFLGALDSDIPLKNVWDSYNEVMKCYNEENIVDTLKKNRQIYLDYLDATVKE